MKYRFLLLFAIIAALIAYFFYPKGQTGTHDDVQSHKTPSSESSPGGSPKFANTQRTPTPHPTPLKGSAGRAVRNFAAQNARFGLSEADVATIQAIFSRHYSSFIQFRSTITTSNKLPDGTIEISFPACPAAGDTALNALYNDIEQTQYSKLADFSESLQDLFRGYTDKAGQNAITYTLTPTTRSGEYNYIRETTMLDRQSKTVLGTGITHGTIDLSKDLNDALGTELEKINQHKMQDTHND